jgi:DNA-directed RNA polymerase specialized sigma subunit
MNVTKKKKTKNYLNNKDMLKEWKTSAEKNAMTDTFARMIMLLTKRYSSKVRFNVCDTFREDMESYALMTVSKVWKSFNPKKSDNTFAYFTQVIKRAFYQYQNMERVHRNIK